MGSPLSVHRLARLLQASHESVERWITILERLYVCYRLSPFGAKPTRAVRKEKKLYFWDWACVDAGDARFENMVAGHLLKYCHLDAGDARFENMVAGHLLKYCLIEDTEGCAMELRFLRDTDGREIDFVVLRDGRPEFAVECKSGDRRASSACRYFRERTEIPRFYQVHLGTGDFGNATSDTRVLPFVAFCAELALP